MELGPAVEAEFCAFGVVVLTVMADHGFWLLSGYACRLAWGDNLIVGSHLEGHLPEWRILGSTNALNPASPDSQEARQAGLGCFYEAVLKGMEELLGPAGRST